MKGQKPVIPQVQPCCSSPQEEEDMRKGGTPLQIPPTEDRGLVCA